MTWVVFKFCIYTPPKRVEINCLETLELNRRLENTGSRRCWLCACCLIRTFIWIIGGLCALSIFKYSTKFVLTKSLTKQFNGYNSEAINVCVVLRRQFDKAFSCMEERNHKSVSYVSKQMIGLLSKKEFGNLTIFKSTFYETESLAEHLSFIYVYLSMSSLEGREWSFCRQSFVSLSFVFVFN